MEAYFGQLKLGHRDEESKKPLERKQWVFKGKNVRGICPEILQTAQRSMPTNNQRAREELRKILLLYYF